MHQSAVHEHGLNSTVFCHDYVVQRQAVDPLLPANKSAPIMELGYYLCGMASQVTMTGFTR